MNQIDDREKQGIELKKLRKQRKFYPHAFYIQYQKGDVLERIMDDLIKRTGQSKVGIIRIALLTYYNFVISNLKELERKK